jgi:hypothetical protein
MPRARAKGSVAIGSGFIILFQGPLVLPVHPNQRVDGGGDAEEESEVHEPGFGVESVVEVFAEIGQTEIREDLQSESAGVAGDPHHLFSVRIDGPAFG